MQAVLDASRQDIDSVSMQYSSGRGASSSISQQQQRRPILTQHCCHRFHLITPACMHAQLVLAWTYSTVVGVGGCWSGWTRQAGKQAGKQGKQALGGQMRPVVCVSQTDSQPASQP